MEAARVSAVLLTQGDRPDDLRAAIASIRAAASGFAGGVEAIVVWNGVEPDPSVVADVSVTVPDNVGIPEGRNLGAGRAAGDLVLFLDDDAVITPAVDLAGVVADFDRDPDLGVVAMRLCDQTGATARRHVPRVGGRSADRSGAVAQFLGGASIHRRRVFDTVGGYAGPFFYAMEETDLALRVIDAGATIRYDADLVVFHPRTLPARHAGSLRRTARNRVWLAHRNLPLPVGIAYVCVWTLVSGLRNLRSASGLRAVLGGSWEGIRRPLGPRRPIRWRTVWRLTRLGRPPVL